MTHRPVWGPDDVDIERPPPARRDDYYLSGSHNFAPDNRAFLRRAIAFAVQCGVSQFLDLGSGIPTAGNVHEVANNLDPDARVVYVDSDLVAVTHSRSLLSDTPHTSVVHADLRDS